MHSNAAKRRVLLFDQIEGGHHDEFPAYVARALRDDVDVAIAAPESARGRLESAAEFVSLGDPAADAGDEPAVRFEAERDRFFEAIREARATHAVHLFADEVVPLLARGRRAPACVSVIVFRKASHYPLRFRSHLFAFEMRRELVFDAWLGMWRQRPDAGVALLFDEYATKLTGRWPGAPAVWLPEAPVHIPEDIVPAEGERRGIALTGALDWRKGLHWLADAIALEPTGTRVTLAGKPVRGYEEQLAEHVQRMRAAGAEVDLRDRWIELDELLSVLSHAQVVAAPYPRHRGSSRLIVEAAAVGTPVVADRYGLLGRQVREHRIGLTVDCAQPRELRRALDSVLAGEANIDAEALRRFAGRYTEERFRDALLTTIAPPRRGRR
jgi:glycosyltransferase involved in cell wall biosynthesis